MCDYCKLNQKLAASFWSYNKEGRRIKKQGINTPYPLPHIDEMLTSIQGCKFLTTLDCTGAFHGLKLSPDAAKKSAFITHLGKFKWNVAPFGLALLPLYYSKMMQDTLSSLEDFARTNLSLASTGRGVLGSFGVSSPFLGTIIMGDAHVLIVCWIMPASNSLLMVLSN